MRNIPKWREILFILKMFPNSSRVYECKSSFLLVTEVSILRLDYSELKWLTSNGFIVIANNIQFGGYHVGVWKVNASQNQLGKALRFLGND